MSQFFDRPIIVDIDRARQIDDLDGTGRGEADFFSRVTIDGKSFPGKLFKGQDDLRPNDEWLFQNDSESRFVNINVQLFESDDGTDPDNNTLVDINPDSGRKDLNLRFDLLTGQITDANTGSLYASSPGQTISLQGAGDRDRGAIEFKIFGAPNTAANASQVLTEFDPLVLEPTSDAFWGQSTAVGDFDNDGVDDLAVGALFKTINGKSQAGGVYIHEGVRNQGLFATGSLIHQDNLRLGQAEQIDQFGEALATGDLNNDGFDDLVIGASLDKVNGKLPGSIQVVYGSQSGLNRQNDQFFSQNTGGITSDPNNGEAFGRSLAVADFNNDGFDDVAIGVPADTVGSIKPGAVQLIYGSPTGLNESRHPDQHFHRNTPGVPGLAANFERFGDALAAGDFNQDGNMDLAIGVPNGLDNQPNAGLVDIIFGGGNSGLPNNPSGSIDVLSQGLSGISDRSGDQFGQTLAVGDFNNDGVDDLAVGAPGRLNKAGVVYVYSGVRGQTDLTSTPQTFFQSAALGGVFEAGDRFGSTLTAKDVNNDGIDDLVIGATGEDNGSGVAHLLFGSSRNGLTTSNARVLLQGSQGVAGSRDSGDNFGASLAIGNFRGETANGRDKNELAISAPSEDFASFRNAGMINVISNSILAGSSLSSSSLSMVQGSRKNETLRGQSQDGVLLGEKGNDRLLAEGGGDIALGGQGRDFCVGGSGDDLLDGGKHSDRYKGGKGYDTFVLASGNGTDTIQDFEKKDRIGLAGKLSFSDLSFKQHKQGTLIQFKNEDLALVQGTKVSELKKNDVVQIEYTRLDGVSVPAIAVESLL